MDTNFEPASAASIERHLRMLTESIGVRLAGSAAERAAAEYLAAAASDIPGARVAIEEFPVWERAVESESLEVEVDGKWESFECSLFGSAPSTGGRVVEAPVVFFDTTTGYKREDLGFLRGRAVVHLGCHLETADHYRRLIEAGPAFLLFVDTRYPGTMALADGLFPAYVQAYGALPTVNVAYGDAWRWSKRRATRARLCVAGERRQSRSQNVIIDLPGNDPEGGIIYAGGHHDTQAGTVGANDNAVGSVSVVEMARILGRKPRRHNLRLISFGAEEQLSVGSASYVRRHRAEIEERGLFMYNMDGCGSGMGWWAVNYNGPDQWETALRETFRRHDLYYALTRDITPYTDQFPFAAAGVPGLWIHRPNCNMGTVCHHRRDDTIENIDTGLMATQIDAGGAFLAMLARTLPAGREGRGQPENQPEIDRVWKELYGGWDGLGV